MAELPYKQIVVIDARAGAAPGERLIAVGAQSAWYELLPDFQVVEIYDGPHRLRTSAALDQLDALLHEPGR